MSDVSLFRLYLLRATYALIAVGLAIMIWPLTFSHTNSVPHMAGVVRCVLTTVSLLALLGIRYPLKMLPLLFFELMWKAIWLVSFGLPLRSAHLLNADTGETFTSCLVGVILVVIVMPWGYVLRQYGKAPGDRWTRRSSRSPV